MSVSVQFANTNKRLNSTKVITSYPLTLSCDLKEPTSILTPSLIVNYNASIVNYNYIYIAAFSRYYFITDVTSLHNDIWEVSAVVDVLASHKSQIGSLSLYVLRSSSQSNGRIIDTKYPVMTRANTYIDRIGSWTLTCPNQSTQHDPVVYSSLFNTALTDGYYYVGVYGANSTGVTWYCMAYQGFLSLATALLNFTPTDYGSIASGLAKQIADPIQYIAGVYWLPFRPLGIGFHDNTIRFGNYSISQIRCVHVDPVESMCCLTASVTIRKHPEAASRGEYLNNAPYSTYKLNIQPWGLVELDSSLMITDTTLTLRFWTDVTTGQAQLSVYATNSLLAKLTCQLGVPINLSQAVVNMSGLLSGATGLLNGVVNAGASLATGNVMGVLNGASQALGGYMSATAAKQPTLSTVGAGGSFLPFGTTEAQALYSDFYYQTPRDNALLGSPLCAVATPASLGGYIMAEAEEVEINCMEGEKREIEGYISSGFFYE